MSQILNDQLPSLQSKVLLKAKNHESYKLYKAGIEWDLIEPIVIEDRDDMKSQSKWTELLEPYYHQITNLITFCRRLPVTLLADDVGLGKTISAGLIASELMARGYVKKVLIVCPKLLMPQWEEELKTKFGILSTQATGSDLVKAVPPDETGAVITTYDSARLHLDQLTDAGYDMLILDEAHKLRNLFGVDPPPKRATRFKQALEERMFRYVLMLTATPIQNRLWDIYSLIELLTVARGHENPFGTPGMFSRKFIVGDKAKALQLNPAMKDEFRKIVYGYMSRIRRIDANLSFPERVVQLHKVKPTSEEKELIKIISEPIQKLNRLAQISILQALTSSPHALSAQLKNMARNETVPQSLSTDVNAVVSRMGLTSKLKGLGILVDDLKAQRPDDWRLVIFTGRRETQTTIEDFLGQHGVTCGLINGDSGLRNQETINKFKQKSPEIHVIVSTEAGAEGVNLQAANVLVNYDLPWNPMIVEQRVGRIQRLGSEHAKVSIFNITLAGTFEEYIVGRLMEKLQMASHAIGDVEAMLEGSGLDEDENGSVGFEEKILSLVLDSLAGKDVSEATHLAEKSIQEAKATLDEEQKNINSLLGGMSEADMGPKCPSLPKTDHSMDLQSFVLAAKKNLGAKVTPQKNGTYLCELDEEQELIRFEDVQGNGTLYAPGTSAFVRLVSKIINKQLHNVKDIDENIEKNIEEITRSWVSEFGANFKKVDIVKVLRGFNGTVLLKVRCIVAHDSYERLISVDCLSSDYIVEMGLKGLEPVNEFVDKPESVGLIVSLLTEKAMSDAGVNEFCRFYKERMVQEVTAAGNDMRKKKKLEDEFTPRIEMSLVGVEGSLHRQVEAKVIYEIDPKVEYTSTILIVPSEKRIVESAKMGKCELTGRIVPDVCLDKCEISGRKVLRHLLVASQISGRKALPEYIIVCSLSGKKVLNDEVEKSVISGELITTSLLKISALSGKRAEPKFFSRCEFTSAEVLESELAVSQISGKKYRIDEQLKSVVSGKTGHQQEFVLCSETNEPILSSEAETCEITKKIVLPGLLEVCEVSKKKVLPSELEKSAISGKKALKKFFVSSSISDARLLEKEAIRSIKGNFCSPLEAKKCSWSDKKFHPEDLKICSLTELPVYIEYLSGKPIRLESLDNLLQGVERTTDREGDWELISTKVSEVIHSKNFKIESAILSPHKKKLAICLEVKTWLGLKVRYAGLIYSINEANIVGRVVIGKVEDNHWLLEDSY